LTESKEVIDVPSKTASKLLDLKFSDTETLTSAQRYVGMLIQKIKLGSMDQAVATRTADILSYLT
jgi:hypothetical protein